jgi:hypothetical protein
MATHMDKDDSPDVIVPGEVVPKQSWGQKFKGLGKKFTTKYELPNCQNINI